MMKTNYRAVINTVFLIEPANSITFNVGNTETMLQSLNSVNNK